MEEKPNIEIIDRIRLLAKKRFGSVKEMEIAVGKTPGFISSYLSRGIIISPEILSILAKNYNVNINWLLTGKGSMLVNSENVEVSESTAVEVPILTNEIALQLIEEIKSIKKFSGIKEVV
jgi:hypothetical protein